MRIRDDFWYLRQIKGYLGWLVVPLLLAIGGCGGPEDPTLPVWGRITVDGKPVKHGDIEFGAAGNNGLRRGAMIVNGEYRTAPMQGLLPGEYMVRIFSVQSQASAAPNPDLLPGDEELGPTQMRDVIPPEYNMRSKQKINVTAEGPNEFNYDIKSKK